jgi:hypothetical protein
MISHADTTRFIKINPLYDICRGRAIISGTVYSKFVMKYTCHVQSLFFGRLCIGSGKVFINISLKQIEPSLKVLRCDGQLHVGWKWLSLVPRDSKNNKIPELIHFWKKMH